jgi:pimeloyl-ACP methyl ester carboxylesterase
VVALVHGAITSAYIWDKNIDALVAAGFRVLRYDHIGCGYSDRPSAKYDADLYDRQLVGLLDSLGLKDPVDLVGYSQGGAISVVFASRHPKRVKRMALLAPAGFPVNVPFIAKATRLPLVGDWITATLGRRILLKIHPNGLEDERNAPELKAKLKEQLRYRGYLPAMLSMLRHYPLDSLKSEYRLVGELKLPTLLIWGDKDKTVPFSNALLVKDSIPHAKLTVIRGGSHAALYERPKEVNGALVEFLTR